MSIGRLTVEGRATAVSSPPPAPFKRLGAFLATGLAIVAGVITIFESRWQWEAWSLTGYCFAGYMTLLLVSKRRSAPRLLVVLLVAAAVVSGSLGSIIAYGHLTRGHASPHRPGQLIAVLKWLRHSLVSLKHEVDDEMSGPSLLMVAGMLNLERMARASLKIEVHGHATVLAELTTSSRPPAGEPKGTAAIKKGAADRSREPGSGPGGAAAPASDSMPPAPTVQPTAAEGSAPSAGAPVAAQPSSAGASSASGGAPASAEPAKPTTPAESEESAAPEETAPEETVPGGPASGELPLTVASG